MVAAAQTEEKVRQQIQDEIEEVERNMLTILQTCSNPSKQQVRFKFLQLINLEIGVTFVDVRLVS